MPNILDALKKPGQAGEPAGPSRLHILPDPERKVLKSGAGRYLLALVLVFSACLLFCQPGAGQSDENGNQQAPPQASSSISKRDRTGLLSSSSIAENTGRMAGRTVGSRPASRRRPLSEMYERLPPQYFTRSNSPGAVASAGKSEAPKWPEPTEAAKSADFSARRAPREKGAEKPESGAAGKVVRFQDIPSRIRDSIPISISMLSCSKRPSESWVNLNGTKMREGEQMASGPRVETITPDGVVFSYQGHSFYKGVRDD